jgi:hypothetical protein
VRSLIVIRGRRIPKVLYPVFPPDKNRGTGPPVDALEPRGRLSEDPAGEGEFTFPDPSNATSGRSSFVPPVLPEAGDLGLVGRLGLAFRSGPRALVAVKSRSTLLGFLRSLFDRDTGRAVRPLLLASSTPFLPGGEFPGLLCVPLTFPKAIWHTPTLRQNQLNALPRILFRRVRRRYQPANV